MISHQEFKKEVERWAEEIDVEFKEIQFREMKKKWASCSSRGSSPLMRIFSVNPKKSETR